MTTTAPQPTKAETLPSGRVVAIAGPVIDVEFPPHALPPTPKKVLARPPRPRKILQCSSSAAGA